MSPEHAEVEALHALGWVLGNDELLPVFLGATGSNLDDVKTRAGEAEFLISLMDFVMMDDAWVISMCDDLGWPYTHPNTVRHSLPGGAHVHWT